jgi:hypothetical protein
MPLIAMLMTAATAALAGIGGLQYACSVTPGLRGTDMRLLLVPCPAQHGTREPGFCAEVRRRLPGIGGGATLRVGDRACQRAARVDCPCLLHPGWSLPQA